MMVRRSTGTAIGSLSLCTLRCMRSSVSRACLLHSGSRFKGSNDARHNEHLHYLHVGQEHQQQQPQRAAKNDGKEKKHGRRSPKGLRPLRVAFQGPPASKHIQKKHWKRTASHSSSNSRGRGRGSKNSTPRRSESSGGGSSAETSGSEDGRDTPARPSSPEIPVPADLGFLSKGARWDSRRRDSRMNGADLYVARITKTGCGNARPCWRCLEWCRWAGIKRIFHWNEVSNQFDVVKVNSTTSSSHYETHADNRLFAGLGW